MSDHARERRRHQRIGAKGTLTIRSPDHEQHGRIANISAGGVYVFTNVSPPRRLLARAVEVVLRLDAGHAEWLEATAKIVRVEPGGMAIAFESASVQLLRVIDDVVTASRARSRVVAVVLIDEQTQRRSAMAAGFRATGCAVVEAATPLEAIVRLGESSFEPDIVAVADSRTPEEAEQMRTFVEREHPRAKLVAIGDEIFQPDGFVHWLSATDSADDLAARVRDVLVAPRRRRY